MQKILEGFLFGLGFFFSLFIIVILVAPVILKTVKTLTSVSKQKKLLTEKMFDDYMEKLQENDDSKEHYEELAKIRDYKAAFKKKKLPDSFFDHYEVKTETKIEMDENGSSLLSGIKKTSYLIKKPSL